MFDGFRGNRIKIKVSVRSKQTNVHFCQFLTLALFGLFAISAISATTTMTNSDNIIVWKWQTEYNCLTSSSFVCLRLVIRGVFLLADVQLYIYGSKLDVFLSVYFILHSFLTLSTLHVYLCALIHFSPQWYVLSVPIACLYFYCSSTE